MGITTCRLEGPVDFYSVGQFVSGPGWRHLRRTIDTFELMFVRRGVLPMRVGEQTLHIEAGQIALLPPNVEHAGADIITSDVDFYWMHFKLPDARMLPDDAGLPLDGQVRFQFHGHAAQALRVVAAALLRQIVRHLP